MVVIVNYFYWKQILKIRDEGIISSLTEALASWLLETGLLTLGVQLSRINFGAHLPRLSQVVVTRLLFAPLIAWSLAALFGFSPGLSSMLIITAGLPVAVNVYILSVEYRNDEELASQAVFWTTLLSVVSLSLFIFFFRV